MFEVIAFYFFAILTLSMALIVVSTSNILYAMSALAASMVFISGFFFLLGAEFLGVVQILVYVGAVIVMYAFGMMFFNASEEVIERSHKPWLVYILGGVFALLLVVILGAPALNNYAHHLSAENLQIVTPNLSTTNVHSMGYFVFTKYRIAFEAGGVMLLSALIGGITTALRKSYLSQKENA
ncbi:NADH-quinone oxidoreductase subunit J [Helicobacter suis]|uniref:NADH-quinone oxidoreductase subunit J n=2 Tax=Helicobacter suis TaxID=104628 RepID=E7G2B0_9HELI|nr:NADH-quinone oxidoreductase subunit J [Helicobacter suis]EFX42485.1 NADH dehydrogenase subunit J [Helicobacter suis HS5]BCD46027.1 NADH-quinone oxidoreductase subunit J [Helicobacter suis]BCD48048.1 NADH-quinone oxidoreductase subunit J [Helicobacter suis]BCD49810.1 NADH-quinone oxidoreductase subunit J [Helicobacter suis]BCD50987.1 NADH-quinone oxidoreductase subunit J [Helicobacter suis]